MKTALKVILYLLGAIWTVAGLAGSVVLADVLYSGQDGGALWRAPLTLILGAGTLALAWRVGARRG